MLHNDNGINQRSLLLHLYVRYSLTRRIFLPSVSPWRRFLRYNARFLRLFVQYTFSKNYPLNTRCFIVCRGAGEYESYCLCLWFCDFADVCSACPGSSISLWKTILSIRERLSGVFFRQKVVFFVEKCYDNNYIFQKNY